MEKRLTGKVAIVTGAGGGVGRAVSVALAAEGAAVVLAGRAAERLKETAGQVTTVGGAAEIVPTELEHEEAIQFLVKATAAKFGRLDILVNNAGVMHAAKLEETATEDWDRLFRVNARAPFILCREALPLLKKAPRAHIINIVSIVGVKCHLFQGAYTASKHALRGMTKVLAEELRGASVRVHSICPGGIDTEMFDKLNRDTRKEDLIKPQEIAELVVYLVTHEGNAVIDELHIRRAAAPPWF
ncbi:MAG: SDR family NAD(P)-dependent oxidoreductase [Planctomycetota bacterium]|jgi:NAD(P)-dependent dehydrogenase (short-subunit alcohol dehydrogenase family)